MGKPRWRYGFILYFRYFSLSISDVRWDDDVIAVVLPPGAHWHRQTARGLRRRGVRQQAQGLYLGGLHWGQMLRHDIQRILQVRKDKLVQALPLHCHTRYTNTPSMFPFSVWQLMWHKYVEKKMKKAPIFKNLCFRYMRFSRMVDDGVTPPWNIVPEKKEGYTRAKLLPTCQVAGDRVFLCRKVYDPRGRRMYKNPYWAEQNKKQISCFPVHYLECYEKYNQRYFCMSCCWPVEKIYCILTKQELRKCL